jgi:hypothetical protein
MEKIFASYSLNRGLIFILYKELHNLKTKRTSNPVNKWVNELDSSQRKFQRPINMWRNVHILSHKGNANEDGIEIPFHSRQRPLQDNKQKQILARMKGKWNPYMMLVGMSVSIATMELSMEVPQKTEKRTIIWPCYTTSGHVSERRQVSIR